MAESKAVTSRSCWDLYDHTPFASLLFFAGRVVWKGFRSPLQGDDTLPTPQWTWPQHVSHVFLKSWDQQADAARNNPRKRPPTAMRVLCILVRWRVLWALFLQMLSVGCRLGAMVVVRLFAQKLSDGSGEGVVGIIMAIAIVLLQWFETIFTCNSTFALEAVVIFIVNCFSTAVLHKGTRLHPEVRGNFPKGALVNLAVGDCGRLVERIHQIGQGVSLPFMVLVGTATGCAFIGPVFLLAVPCTTFLSMLLAQVGKWQGHYFRAKVVAQGRRLGIVNEMLQNMRLTKFYAVEDLFHARIMSVRRSEERALRNVKFCIALNWSLAVFLPLFTTGVILIVYRAAYGKLPPVPDMVAVIAVVKVLTVPFGFFGNSMGLTAILRWQTRPVGA